MKRENLNVIEGLENVKAKLASLGIETEASENNEKSISDSNEVLDQSFLLDEGIQIIEYCDCFGCDCQNEAEDQFDEYSTEDSLDFQISEALEAQGETLDEMSDLLDEYKKELIGWQSLLVEVTTELQAISGEMERQAARMQN